jgi:hypothetical protein
MSKTEEIGGVAIRVGGAMVAWFADPDQAVDWARENYFGQWLMNPCSIPNRPPFTPEQIEAAKKRAEEMLALISPGRVAE